MTAPCALYRLYNADHDLIYVGASVAPIARLSEHVGRAEWGRTAATMTMAWFPSRQEAFEAERAAILAERPMFNSAGRKHRGGIKRLGSGADNGALIARIYAHCEATGETPTGFGKRAVNDFALMHRLKAGCHLRGPTVAKINAALASTPSEAA